MIQLDSLGLFVVLILAFMWGMFFGTLYERRYGVHRIGGYLAPPCPWPHAPSPPTGARGKKEEKG
jgi:hypothetical protein